MVAIWVGRDLDTLTKTGKTCFGHDWMRPEVRPVEFQGAPLRWRHNGLDSVSNHQPHDCLLNRLFRRRSMASYMRKMFPFDDVIMLKFDPSNQATQYYFIQQNDISN